MITFALKTASATPRKIVSNEPEAVVQTGRSGGSIAALAVSQLSRMMVSKRPRAVVRFAARYNSLFPPSAAYPHPKTTMNVREIAYKTCRIALMHLFACVLFWVWMGVVALGYGFADRDRWSIWVHAQVYAIPKVALTLTFPGRLIFEQIDGWPWLLIVVVSNSLLWAAIIVATLAFWKRRLLS